MGSYVLDFYCRTARVAVELDGDQHARSGRKALDEKRDAWLSEQGVQVLRVPNHEALTNMAGVLETILRLCSPIG